MEIIKEEDSMSDSNLIRSQAISKLANTMRIYVEEHVRFSRLKNVDLEEAIHNLDRAMDNKLEAFHTLYDITKNEFDYFEHGDCTLLILLRNALHHRNHLLFKSWNQYMVVEKQTENYMGAEFLFADYYVMQDTESRMRYFYKLEDFYFHLDESLGSPYLREMNKIKNIENLDLIKKDLNWLELEAYYKKNRYPMEQVYINIMPIFISAVCKVFKYLKDNGVDFTGFDAGAYCEPFTNELWVDFKNIHYKTLRII